MDESKKNFFSLLHYRISFTAPILNLLLEPLIPTLSFTYNKEIVLYLCFVPFAEPSHRFENSVHIVFLRLEEITLKQMLAAMFLHHPPKFATYINI